MSTSQVAPDHGLADTTADFVASALPVGNTGEAAETSEDASRALKGLLIGFAATVTVGLGLASWYVGARIEAAGGEKANRAPAASKAAVASPPQPPTAVAPPPELYLSVAGLGAQKDPIFANKLEAEGYQARIQSGTDQEGDRILIGPFAGRTALEEAERTLAADGVLATEIIY